MEDYNMKSCAAYRITRIPVTMSELEGHFCCYDWQNASRGPSASAELLVLYRTIPNPHDVT